MLTRPRTGNISFLPQTSHFLTFAVALSALAIGACAKEPGYKNADGGSGGASATTGGTTGTASGGTSGGARGGTPGRGDYTAPACDSSASTMGKVTTPAPLISIGKPIFGSADTANAKKLVDGLFPHNGVRFPAAMLPAWYAIQLGAGPTRVMLTWVDSGWDNFNNPANGGSPADYTIETSADSTNGQDGTWTNVATVTANPVRERAHTFAFAGKSWVRMSMTAAASATSTTPLITLDEIEVHDVSATGTVAPQDTWFFMGDSITVNAFRRQFGAAKSFDGIVHAARPDFAPVVINGGIGGELSNMGVMHLAQWLMLNPDARHIALLYGTNDSWGDKAPSSTMFEVNMRMIVQTILDAGRVPIIARIPYSVQAKTTLPQFNKIVDTIATEKKLPCGPDLYGWFRDHPEEVSPDGVHPSEAGYQSINKLWANAMLGMYPAAPAGGAGGAGGGAGGPGGGGGSGAGAAGGGGGSR